MVYHWAFSLPRHCEREQMRPRGNPEKIMRCFCYPLFKLIATPSASLRARNDGKAQLFVSRGKAGGAKRDRTADLYNAIVALSQLSYGPITTRM